MAWKTAAGNGNEATTLLPFYDKTCERVPAVPIAAVQQNGRSMAPTSMWPAWLTSTFRLDSWEFLNALEGVEWTSLFRGDWRPGLGPSLQMEIAFRALKYRIRSLVLPSLPVLQGYRAAQT